MKAILGTKLGMTQLFDTEGNVQRVTLIHATPNVVTQLKTEGSDGYNAVQLGFGTAKHLAKPQEGHMKPAKAESKVMREIRFKDVQTNHPLAKDRTAAQDEAMAMAPGEEVTVEAFTVGDSVQVTGTSKGKGFAGTVKRHNFATGPKTHGSRNYREPGSIGAGYPQHVMKGMRMAGRMGGDKVTVTGLKIVVVDAERNLLAISGAVPGPRKGLVMVKGF